MELGIIGLGRMGGNMAERLRLGGHKVVGFDFKRRRGEAADGLGIDGCLHTGGSGEEPRRSSRHLDYGAAG